MNNNITVTDSDISFESLKHKDYYPNELDEEIRNSNVIILPYENFREGFPILFPETTKEMYSILKAKENAGFKVEVLASESNFKEIELHYDVVYIATILIKIGSTIVLGLIVNWLYDMIKLRGKKPKDVNAKFDVLVEKTKTKTTKKIHYDGPVEGMKDALEQAIKGIENEDDR